MDAEKQRKFGLKDLHQGVRMGRGLVSQEARHLPPQTGSSCCLVPRPLRETLYFGGDIPTGELSWMATEKGLEFKLNLEVEVAGRLENLLRNL